MYRLQVELPDNLRQSLERAAANAGKTPEDWAGDILRRQLGQRDQRLRSHFGAVNLGAPTGMDNESIEADLARAYADTGD